MAKPRYKESSSSLRALPIRFWRMLLPVLRSVYLATHAENHRSKYPLAADAVRHNCFMDDLMPSVPTVEIAKETRRQLTELGSRLVSTFVSGFLIDQKCLKTPQKPTVHQRLIWREISFQLRRRWESCGLQNATPSHSATN